MKVYKIVIGFITLAGVTTANAAGHEWGQGHSRSVEQIETRAAEKFAQLDTDASGTISQEEFAALKPSHRRHHRGHPSRNQGRPAHAPSDAVREEISNKMFEAADTDGDGSLSREETRSLREHAPEVIRDFRFARMDKNSDSVLTPDEFPPFASRVREIDTNGDGEVSTDEIRAAMPGHARAPNAG